MDYIESMHIEGFKKFERINISFNEHMNILVGENEAGKSTILEAIKIVLNQLHRNADKSVLKELFNLQMIKAFEITPSIQTLPRIYIEIKMALNPKGKNPEFFYGEVNKSKSGAFGVSFECSFDEELGSGLDAEISAGKIPYEYYTLKWTTFAGHAYQPVKRPLNFLAINTSDYDSSNSFNYYNKALFSSSYNDETRMSAKNTFRDCLTEAFGNVGLPDIDTKRKFGINDKKVILESIISVFEDDIPIENRGSGMENLIKTQIALDRKKSHLDVVLIEEPENHLCFSNLKKMLKEISNRQSESQIIIATHSNMIASNLNLNNVLWITDKEVKSLKCVNADIAKFFVKADDSGFLQLLLSEKAILVEGATEHLLLPQMYKKVVGRTPEEDHISVISCRGISYKNYLEIAKATGKKIAVITDNDKSEDTIKESILFNKADDLRHVFLGLDVKDWTWEASLYNLNKDILDGIVDVQKDAKYLFHGNDCGQVLGKMLNNKVETAYKLITSEVDFEIPEYVKDAISWLNK